MTEGTQESENPVGRIALGRRLVSNALRYSSAPIKDTSIFKKLKHDADLVPRVTAQLNSLLDAFQRDTAVAYDIQGRSDYGCDVLVRLNTGNEVSFIGIQIKSHTELTEKGIVRLLRDQHSRASDLYTPYHKYYIFLAADLTDKNSRQQQAVRDIQQAFAKKSDVEVVSPLYASTFLRLSGPAMDSLLARTIRQGDPVLDAALADLSRNPIHAAIILYLLVSAVEGRYWVSLSELISSPWLTGVAHHLPSSEASPLEISAILRDGDLVRRLEEGGYEYYHEEYGFYRNNIDYLPAWLIAQFLRPTIDPELSPDDLLGLHGEWPMMLEQLEDDVIIDGAGPDLRLAIRLEEHPALVCLATEARVKNELEGSELIEYLVDLVLGRET